MFFPANAPADRHGSDLRSLRFSMNAPVVALEGLPVGPARAAVALHPGPETRVTIALRAVRSGQLLYFCAGEELADLPSASVAMDAALSFAESMGFLFDDDVVELGGGEGGQEAALQWAEFIDAVAEPSAPRREVPAPERKAPRPARAVEASPGETARIAVARSDERTSLTAAMPEALDDLDALRAPLAMLEDDTENDELPFWLLQPDPPHRRARPPLEAADPPDQATALAEEPAAPAQSEREPGALDPDAIGLARKASASPRARTVVTATPPPARAERPARRAARPVETRPEARRSERSSPKRAKRSPAHAEPSASEPAEVSSELRSALAGTGIDQILMGLREVPGGSAEPLPAATAPPARPPAPDPAVARARAAATLSKFRIHASVEAKPAAVRALELPAPADERKGEPEPRREFESLGLRLRSRF
jgi:hypothetical protein